MVAYTVNFRQCVKKDNYSSEIFGRFTKKHYLCPR